MKPSQKGRAQKRRAFSSSQEGVDSAVSLLRWTKATGAHHMRNKTALMRESSVTGAHIYFRCCQPKMLYYSPLSFSQAAFFFFKEKLRTLLVHVEKTFSPLKSDRNAHQTLGGRVLRWPPGFPGVHSAFPPISPPLECKTVNVTNNTPAIMLHHRAGDLCPCN